MDHLVCGGDEGGVMVTIAKGKVCIFLCQLLGLHANGGQRGCHHDLILKGPLPKEREADLW